MKVISRYLLYGTVFGLLGLLVTQLAFAERFEIANLLDWSNSPTLVSGTTNADKPVIASAPNGDVMIVFSRWNNDSQLQNDPYFTILEAGQSTWTTPQIINQFQSPNTFARVDVDFDQTSTAHAVWVEFDTSVTPTTSYIRYAQKQAAEPTNWLVDRTLYTASLATGKVEPIEQARILVASDNSLHVVWATDGEVVYRTSNNGGVDWIPSLNQPPETIQNGGGRLPEIVESADGTLHVVWEQQVGGTADSVIYYSRKPTSGNWSTSIEISGGIPGTDAFQQPDVVIAEGYINATYTFVDPANPEAQVLYLSRCSLTTNCANAANWTDNYTLTTNPITVNDNAPFSVLGRFAYDVNKPNQGLHVFYHGYFPNQPNVVPNERIWSSNSCDSDDWENIIPDEVETDDNVVNLRNANPSVLFVGGRLHLVYEQIDELENYSVYYTSTDFSCGDGGSNGGDPDNDIYLPFISQKGQQ